MACRSRRLFGFALGVAVCSAATDVSARADAPDPRLVQQLSAGADGAVQVRARPGTGRIGFMQAGRDGDLLPTRAGAQPKTKAVDFLARYAPLLGVEDDSTLAEVASEVDANGTTHVTYAQRYKGLPVFGTQIKVHVDSDGDLTAVNGVAVPDIDLSVAPRLSPAQAAARAITVVAAEPLADDGGARPTAGLRADSAFLVVYRTGLIRGVEGTNQLAYQVEVADGAGIREVVFVHANAGKVLNRYSATPDALHRVLYEQSPANKVWEEGDPFPGALNADQRNIVAFSGDAYRLFSNAFGRDSYDGAGAFMRAVNNDPGIACPNANWNSTTTNYCNGVTSDDVVVHEWAHAYTEFTHDLIYQWQPGALNESYSDIWGEVADRINGAGSDLPDTARTVGTCTSHTTPLPILRITAPSAIAGDCAAGPALFGPSLSLPGVTGNVVLATDGVSGTDTSTTNGCTPPFTNSSLVGKIALIDRGVCNFAVKVKNAQNAGAIAVVIGNTANTTQQMTGGDASITIPSLLVALDHRNLIAGRLAAGDTVSVTLRPKSDTTPEDSYRWLGAEDATAFNPSAPAGGHAIRDMWNPNCLSDPGKVTDAEYHCATTDAGGVHTNSGVPNHGFALLADGGTYNGHTVAGLGLTKAAHIYWRAQAVYQTPASDFADHADALEASCNDLVGAPLRGLSTGAPAGPSGQTIAAADCGAIKEMAAAVELRTSPVTQCNFQPLLQPGRPALCGPRTKRKVVYAAGFDRGLDGWTVSNVGRYAGWPRLNWQSRGALPGGRRGRAAYAVDPTDGSCDQGAGDFSGVMQLTSPSIKLPSNRRFSPRLTFEHYVATEFGYDGGNIKISVNRGPFALLPASAFRFNAYNTTFITETDGNTNPLAGQSAFSGTDGGEVTGSWGQSQVDLSSIGVRPGDRVQLRFDFGMDGCGGVDGWYVDDIQVEVCESKKHHFGKLD